MPLRQVEHWPTYVTTVPTGSGLRDSGEYPQGASVADEQATGALEDVCIEAKSLILAGVDLVLSPVRAIVEPPCSVVRSSSEWYRVLPFSDAYDMSAWTHVQVDEPTASP